MNSLLKFFFPFLNRNNQKSLLNKILTTLANIWLLIWLLFWIVYFPHQHTYKYTQNNVTLYAENKFHIKKMQKELMQSLTLLNKKDINFSRLHADIYIYNKSFDYYFRLFPGLQTMAIGTTSYAIGDTISMQNIDLNENLFNMDNEGAHQDKLYTLIAHELVHVWSYDRYGFINNFFIIPVWVKEGFSCYVASQENQLFNLMKNKLHIDTKKSFFKIYLKKNTEIMKHTPADYFAYTLMVKYAIEKMHISVDDLHLGKVDYDEVIESLLKEHNILRE